MGNMAFDKNDSNITISTIDILSDLSKVDAHLADLYRRAVGAEESGTAVPIVKTVLSNLIVYASTEQEAEEAVRNVSEITGKHPSRVIVVDTVSPQTGELPATVSVVCGITERGDRQLCGEIIRIHAHEASAGLTGMIMPLIVGDVPVFLWVPGDIPENDDNFDELLSVASHIILDNRRVSELRNVHRFLPSDESAPMLLDLCWSSLLLWREYTAQHFDPPIMRDYLSGINSIDIRYALKENEEIISSVPLLFASWLIERNELHISQVLRSGTSFHIEAVGNNTPVIIKLTPEISDSSMDKLTSVAIRSQIGDRTATFITQSISGSELSLSEECPGICLPPRILEIPNATEAALVSEALETYRRDEVYEAALSTAIEVLNRLSEQKD